MIHKMEALLLGKNTYVGPVVIVWSVVVPNQEVVVDGVKDVDEQLDRGVETLP